MFDLHNNVKAVCAIAGSVSPVGTKTGPVIDRQGYSAVEFIVNHGAVTTTGTTATVVILEGDATGSMTSVADADLLGTEALASLPAATPRTAGSTKEVAKRVGYRGLKRYVQAKLVTAVTSTVGGSTIVALLGEPNNAPVDNSAGA